MNPAALRSWPTRTITSKEFFGASGIQDAIDSIWGTGILPDDGLIYVEALNAYNGFTIDASTHSILATLLGVVSVSDNGSADTIISGSVNVTNLISGFTLSGFTVNGAVFFNINSGNLVLNDLAVKNSGGNGITVMNHSGAVTMTDVKSSGNSNGHGASISVANGGNITVTRGAFDHNAQASTGRGLYLETSGVVTINNLSASGNSHEGLIVQNFSRLTINNATVKYNGLTGMVISTSQAANVSLQNLYAQGNTGTNGITLTTAGSVTALNIYANENRGGNSTGMYINTSSGTGTVRVTNGQFNGNSSMGLYIASARAITLTSVRAEGNDWTGVLLDNSSGSGNVIVNSPKNAGAADANIFNDNGNYGLQVHGSGAVTLANLQVCGNQSGLFVNNTWGTGAVTINKTLPYWTNLFDGNGSDGMYIQTNGTLAISDSSASGSLGTRGLRVDSTAKTVTLTRVQFDDNKHAGAYIEASGAVRLTDVCASGNGAGGSHYGVYIDNHFGAGAAVTIRSSVKNVYREFNNNTADGIRIFSYGAVSVSGVHAEHNNPGTGVYVNNQADTRPAVTLTGIIALDNSVGVNILSKGAISARDIEASGNSTTGMALDNSYGSGNVLVSPSSKTGLNRFIGNGFYGLGITSKGIVTLSGILAEGNNNTNLFIDNKNAPAPRAVSVSNSEFIASLAAHGLRIETIGNVTLNEISASGNYQHGVSIDATYNNAIASVTIQGKQWVADFSANGSSGLNISTRGAVTLQNVRSDDNGSYGVYIYNRYFGSAAPVRLSASKGLWNSASGNQGTQGLYIQSYGAISIARLLCEGNQQYGAYLLNTRESPDLPVRAVSITSSTFSDGITYDGLYIESEGPVAIRDSHVDGNKRRGMGIFTKGTVTLSGVTANGNQGTSASYPGVYIDNTSGDGDVVINSSKAVQTEFSWNLYHGLRIVSNGAVSIANASAEHNAAHGVYISNSASSISVTNTSRVAASRFSGNGDIGLFLLASGPITLSGNILIEGNTNDGAVLGNSITGASNPQPVTVSGAASSGNGKNGFRVLSYGDITISSVVAENNGLTGTTAEDRTGLYLNNYLSGGGGIGNLTVTGRNVLSNNNGYGLRATSNGVINISGVTAQGNADRGLYVWGYGAGKSVTLRDITAINNLTDGIYLVANGDQTLRNITSLMNGRHGIHTYLMGNYSLLHTIMVMGNDGHGIFIQTGTTGIYALNSCVYIGNDADNIGGEKDLNITT